MKTLPFEYPPVPPPVRIALAPHGILRAGINLSNMLLVSARNAAGEPVGVSPDMARAVATALGAECQLVPYQTPGEVADAGTRGEWTIGLIGAEPQRAETIDFSPPYAQIEACYLVRGDARFGGLADVDRDGVRIVTTARAAFTLWLERNIRNAEIILAGSLDESFAQFRNGDADVLASLKAKLREDVAKVPGARIIEPGFMTVQQAIGIPRGNDAAAEWLRAFVIAACRSGFVAQRIRHHGVTGLDAATL